MEIGWFFLFDLALCDVLFLFARLLRGMQSAGGYVLTRVRNSIVRETRETVIDDDELGKALDQASAIDNEYFRLRALAVLSCRPRR